MSCGKKPLVKKWDRPRKLEIIKPSPYEKNLDSVKVHWKKVMADMELFYKDDQFWESQCETVRGLVGPIIFKRLAKIFELPAEAKPYEPRSETSSLVASETYYAPTQSKIRQETRSAYSMSSFVPSTEEDEEEEEEEEMQEEQAEEWSVSSERATLTAKKSSRFKSMTKGATLSKSASKYMSKSYSKFVSRSQLIRSQSSRSKSIKSEALFSEESADTLDDLIVHPARHGRRPNTRIKNPHFEMLYCNESETDMIKWNSKYKVKIFEVSASDEYSKKAEIIAKQISKDFYVWWLALGNVEFKSEIKRPEDIEALFQVWFDEHASQGLVLHPKILPCVLNSIAKYVGVPKTACPRVLKRQIAFDIEGETTPAHLMAFGTCLPHKMKHIPPKNNTAAMWHGVKVPEDLRSMACVWEDVNHLTSTKAFQKWLEQHPHLPMPACLESTDTRGDKKQLFVVPSDYVVKNKNSSTSAQDLALPVSQFSLELKEVLSKLMNQ